MFRMLIPFAFIFIILAGCSIDSPSPSVDRAIEEGGAYKEDVTAIKDKSEAKDDEAYEDISQEIEKIESDKVDSEVVKVEDLKLLSTHQLKAETEDFTSDLNAIIDNAHELGGYIRSNDVDEQPVQGKKLMQSELTLRVPKEKANEMIDFINETVSVVGETIASVDVSKEYYDIKARIKNLESREERLRELYDRSDNINDIITIDDKLFEVTEEREQAVQKHLRMQDRISFSRIDVNLLEVKKVATAKEENLTGFAKIEESFYSMTRTVATAAANILSFLIKFLPIIVLIGGGYYLYRKILELKIIEVEMKKGGYKEALRKMEDNLKSSGLTKEEIREKIKKESKERQDDIVEKIKEGKEARKETPKEDKD